MAHSHLTLKNRERIERLLAFGFTKTEIARRLGVHRSTVSREVARNSHSNRYRARRAQKDAMNRKKRPKGIIIFNRIVQWKATKRYPTYEPALLRNPFTGKDFSIRTNKYKCKWNVRYSPVIRKPLTYKQIRLRKGLLKNRKRDHDFESFLRPARDWVALWQRGKYREYRRYPYRERWRGVPGCSDSPGIWFCFKTRPNFKIGYWRAHIRKCFEKQQAEKEQIHAEAAVAPTSSPLKPIVYLPLFIRQPAIAMRKKWSALVLYAKGSAPPLKNYIAAVLLPLFSCPAKGSGHFFWNFLSVFIFHGPNSLYIFQMLKNIFSCVAFEMLLMNMPGVMINLKAING